jgi:hypothetical protein
MFAITRAWFSCSVLAAALLSQAPTSKLFEAPFRVEADGKPIAAVTGHAAPFVLDFDGDGVFDLAVGEFGSTAPEVKGGTCRLYRNIGSNQVPKFAAFSLLQTEGKPAAMESS